MDQLAVRIKCVNQLSGQNKPTIFEEKMDWLAIRVKKDQLAIKVNQLTDQQIYWLAGQWNPNDYQDKMTIRVKGAN